MASFTVKVPDVGEGVAEAELVEWHVAVGDVVREDDLLAAVMTDKATVEIPSPVAGRVERLAGEIGATIAVGSELVSIDTGGTARAAASIDNAGPQETASTSGPADAEKPAERNLAAGQPAQDPVEKPQPSAEAPGTPRPSPASRRSSSSRGEGQKPLAAPSVRGRAREAGIDLRFVPGTGPAGRITHEDLDLYLEEGAPNVAPPGRQKDLTVTDVPVVGLRRRIAQRMALAASRIPHITIVEEVDVTALEELRGKLNGEHAASRGRLTLLPFLMLAIVRAVRDQPALNAHFDDEAEVLRQHGGVHIGIATQTRNGLMVPKISHVEAMDLWEAGREVARLSTAARDGTATREQLSGSTITITSLGALGALATTPIINHPEVAIVGVNRMAIRPAWDGRQFVPRSMMNLSCSFDHRVIDGWDAAIFVQKLKSLLETPAMIFVGDRP